MNFCECKNSNIDDHDGKKFCNCHSMQEIKLFLKNIQNYFRLLNKYKSYFKLNDRDAIIEKKKKKLRKANLNKYFKES